MLILLKDSYNLEDFVEDELFRLAKGLAENTISKKYLQEYLIAKIIKSKGFVDGVIDLDKIQRSLRKGNSSTEIIRNFKKSIGIP